MVPIRVAVVLTVGLLGNGGSQVRPTARGEFIGVFWAAWGGVRGGWAGIPFPSGPDGDPPTLTLHAPRTPSEARPLRTTRESPAQAAAARTPPRTPPPGTRPPRAGRGRTRRRTRPRRVRCRAGRTGRCRRRRSRATWRAAGSSRAGP